MKSEAMQTLKKELSSAVGIFVETDAFAFFDVNGPTISPEQEVGKWFDEDGNIENNEIVDIEKIKDNPIEHLYNQPYNFLVDENCIRYFRRGDYKGRLWTVSVTTPCIVFCAYTARNIRNKPSGVYHFYPPYPPDNLLFKSRLRKNLSNLIDTVRQTEREEVIVKAVGGDYDELSPQEIRDAIVKTLKTKNLKAEPSYFLLEEGHHRITEFHPNIDKLITYFENSEDKTIL
jgi:hypothetical protein